MPKLSLVILPGKTSVITTCVRFGKKTYSRTPNEGNCVTACKHCLDYDP